MSERAGIGGLDEGVGTSWPQRDERAAPEAAVPVRDAVELEIGAFAKDESIWTLELRSYLPKEDAERRLTVTGNAPDLDELRRHANDDEAYGLVLTQALFGNRDVGEAFEAARAVAETRDLPLRLRLFIGPGSAALHAIHWETLRDPESGAPLLTSENVLFSRYLSSLDWRPVPVRAKTRLRALIVVPSPSDLDRWRPDGRNLAPLDVEAEVQRARVALGPVQIKVLAGSQRPTFQNLIASLRDEVDLVYLACHGYLVGASPQLVLEDDDGRFDRIPGSRLVDTLNQMRTLPRLVVLASCQSAGSGDESHTEDGGALASLGPRLAEVGVPAVLAMQGNVSMATMARFLPTFFTELHRDGQIDRAAAVARASVQHRPDWWAPALFMRLRSGRIWYHPGFSDEHFDKWPSLVRAIRKTRCTPVLGPGLTDSLIGSRKEWAQRWAEKYHFPMAADERDDLPQVAQYLAVNQGALLLPDELREYVEDELRKQFAGRLPDEKLAGALDEILTAVGSRMREENEADPHRVLAELSLPIYITTHPANLLAAALTAEGKQPVVELCRWRDDIAWPSSIYDTEPDYRPSPQRPLVFHLFGHLSHPESLVLTEDDYFDYLIGITSNKNLIPAPVLRALTDASLLFLGFRVDEWEFRVLFRSIMNRQGGLRRSNYVHVAVQIDPEESNLLEPERARRYLERYFQGADISIYWGTTDDFGRELKAANEAGADG
jgi:hypothetical protein